MASSKVMIAMLHPKQEAAILARLFRGKGAA
jgi:hypothetical protein